MNPKITVILLLTAFLGGMAAYMISVVRHAEPAPALVKQECIDAELQEKIRKLAAQGFDLAFIDRTQLLFDIWTKDPSTAKAHPERGQVGMQNAINAYIYALDLANNWSAPKCPSKPVGVPR